MQRQSPRQATEVRAQPVGEHGPLHLLLHTQGGLRNAITTKSRDCNPLFPGGVTSNGQPLTQKLQQLQAQFPEPFSADSQQPPWVRASCLEPSGLEGRGEEAADTASGPRNALLDGKQRRLTSFPVSAAPTRKWANWRGEWTPLSLTQSQPGPRRPPFQRTRRPQPPALPLVSKHIWDLPGHSSDCRRRCVVVPSCL